MMGVMGGCRMGNMMRSVVGNMVWCNMMRCSVVNGGVMDGSVVNRGVMNLGVVDGSVMDRGVVSGGVLVGVSNAVDGGAMAVRDGGMAVYVGHGDGQERSENESLKRMKILARKFKL